MDVYIKKMSNISIKCVPNYHTSLFNVHSMTIVPLKKSKLLSTVAKKEIQTPLLCKIIILLQYILLQGK